MRKDEEKNREDSTFNKANSEEMLFVLRGQDLSAPKVIIHWIAKNFENVSDEKLRDAFECALKMKKNAVRRSPD